MSKFTVHNEKYKAVLTGQTVRIIDKGTGEEAARFKGLKYAYRAAFNTSKNLLVVKSTEPWIAFYCLETMSLVRKIKCKGTNMPQDSGFCISHDEKYVFNIEMLPKTRVVTHLVKYDCAAFEETGRLFEEENYWFYIIDRHENGYLLSGMKWDSELRRSEGTFIAEFDGGALTKIHEANDPLFFKNTNPYSEIHYQY